MKLRLSLRLDILIVIACTIFLNSDITSAKNRNDAYIDPVKGEIPIICDGPFHKVEGITEPAILNSLMEVKDCGFNSFTKYSDKLGQTLVGNILDASEEVGLKYIVKQWSLADPNYVKGFVERFKSYPALGGWYVADEPSGENLLQYIKCAKDVLATDQNHINYMVYCINPGFPPKKKYPKNGFKKLEAYLKYIDKQYAPSVWPFDFYPIRESVSNGQSTGIKYADPDFYRYLEIFRNISLKTKRPFWSYCLIREILFNDLRKVGNEYKTGLQAIMPAQTEGTLRYAAFTSLAYGAQGLVFWGYTQGSPGQKAKIVEPPLYPSENPFEYYTEEFKLSPIDSEGNRTAVWTNLKSVLSEINKYKELFYQAETIDVRHTTSISGTRKIKFPFGKLSSLTTEAAGVTASLLKKGEYKYLILVSHDPFNRQIITPKFKKDATLVEITSPIYADQNSSSGSIILEPGGYMIYRWKE